jgi:hypothetical protein
VKTLDDIATITSQRTIREALCHQGYEITPNNESKKDFLNLHISYRDALRALYEKIRSFQMPRVCFFKKTFERVTRDAVKWNDCDKMLADIKELDNTLKSTEGQWRDMKYDEECKLHAVRHEQRMRGLSAIEGEVSKVH